ncbi:Uncharacterised protein [Vibrio cholerae]|nr:Uncharacterised protein [Vibrio cholerae]
MINHDLTHAHTDTLFFTAVRPDCKLCSDTKPFCSGR